MLGMMVQSTAVTFGAVGTPIMVGVQGGLGGEAFAADLAAAGWIMQDYLNAVTAKAVIMPTKILAGEVDCTKRETLDLCHDWDVHHYPTLIFASKIRGETKTKKFVRPPLMHWGRLATAVR